MVACVAGEGVAEEGSALCSPRTPEVVIGWFSSIPCAVGSSFLEFSLFHTLPLFHLARCTVTQVGERRLFCSYSTGADASL